jgi:DNA-binding MarR family transcriptional regulator
MGLVHYHDFTMSSTVRADEATEFWTAVTDLWLSERPPRFPAVAAEFDLSPMGLRMLYEVRPGQERPMRDVAATVGCDASNITGIADRLEGRGLIERRDAPGDRRVKLIALTDAGAELRARVLERLYQPPEALLRLSREEQITLRDIMVRSLPAGD